MKHKCFNRVLRVLIIVILTLGALTALVSCNGRSWQEKFDTSLPTLDEKDGWVQTMNDDFSKFSSIEEVYEKTNWGPVVHKKRKTEYWCEEMVTFDKEEGAVVIKSIKTDDHICDICETKSGIFTSGIETVKVNGDKREESFAQAFGYFEAEVKVPTAEGMWSAFWLQSSAVGKIGSDGKDGTEIDVYESSFVKNNPTKTGNALHWDAYDPPYYKCVDHVTDVKKNLYDGEYHKYSLLWTPEYYVFYVDGEAVWATDAGGVSKVPEYLRLTVEIRDGKIGPYGQTLGRFENHDDGSTDFAIKNVSVWQNDSYKESIRANSDYKDMKGTYQTLITVAVVLGVAIVIVVIGIVCAAVVAKKRKKQSV